ncbi:MAG: sulfatase/phosphatase domain-containing protein [Acidobacteriota bacterium]
MIIKFPEQKFKNKKIREFVSLIDIFPTLFDYYNIKIPAGIEGISLLNHLKGGEVPGRVILSSIFHCKPYVMAPGKIALISEGYKLIYN